MVDSVGEIEGRRLLQNLSVVRNGDVTPGIYTPKTPTSPASRKFG